MRRNRKATFAGIMATVLAALLLSACGSQQGPSPSEADPASQPAVTVPESPTSVPESPTAVPVPANEAPTAAALAEDEPPGDVEIGSKVGNRVPDFDMLLADGSTVTTSDLLAASKPVFLMFFASW